MSDIAALRGVSPSVLRRRVRRLVKRMASDEFLFVSRHVAPRHGGSCPWSSTRRRVAEACVLRGLSLRQAASLLNLSLHTVRTHRGAVAALFDSVRA